MNIRWVVLLVAVCAAHSNAQTRDSSSLGRGGRSGGSAMSADRLAAMYDLTGARKEKAAELLDSYLKAMVPLQQYFALPSHGDTGIDSVRKATRLRYQFDSALRSLMRPDMQKKFDSVQAAMSPRRIGGG